MIIPRPALYARTRPLSEPSRLCQRRPTHHEMVLDVPHGYRCTFSATHPKDRPGRKSGYSSFGRPYSQIRAHFDRPAGQAEVRKTFLLLQILAAINTNIRRCRKEVFLRAFLRLQYEWQRNPPLSLSYLFTRPSLPAPQPLRACLPLPSRAGHCPAHISRYRSYRRNHS